jgi:multidrug efflux pump subunit AcrA (membrane-fusion protein)
MNSPLLRKLMSAVVALLLLFYIGYQIYSTHYTNVQTETATFASTADTVQVTGTAIRRESVITSKVNGVIDYLISDGGKVANGGIVAQIYASSQSAAAQQQLQDINNAIAKLQALSAPGDTYAADLDSINKQINLKLAELLGKAGSCEYSDLAQSREEFLYLVNERQIVTDKTSNFSARINALKAQQSTLAAAGAKITGSIKAPAAGYFMSTADGFESVFDYSNVLSLTPSMLKAKQSSKPAAPADAVGKVCTDYNWYFAFVVPINQISQFKVGDTVSMQFPFASTEPIPATVDAVNQEPKESQAAVILQSNRMSGDISTIRNETAQIQVQKYTGLRVSQKAVHFQSVSKTTVDKNKKSTTVKKDVQGVYIMHGSEVRFKQIFPLYSTDSYVICDSNPSKGDLMTDTTVQLSDEVVVEGTDLYDGKVVK